MNKKLNFVKNMNKSFALWRLNKKIEKEQINNCDSIDIGNYKLFII